MTCPLSLVLLAITLFVTHTYHATLSDAGDATIPKMANVDPLSSHILDTTRGRPAAGVKMILYKLDTQSNGWIFMNETVTNQDGRVTNIILPEDFTEGAYKLNFDTKGYFDSLGMKTFYPYVEIIFQIDNPLEHYHVPLLLNPYGYSTYRGS